MLVNRSTLGKAAWLTAISFFHAGFEALAVNELRYLQLHENKVGRIAMLLAFSSSCPRSPCLLTLMFTFSTVWKLTSQLRLSSVHLVFVHRCGLFDCCASCSFSTYNTHDLFIIVFLVAQCSVTWYILWGVHDWDVATAAFLRSGKTLN